MKKIIPIIGLLLLTSKGWASLAFGGSTRGAVFAANNTVSFTGPSVLGNDILALTCIGVSNTATISTPTWGGISMFEITGASSGDANNSVKIFYLLSPPLGASTVIATSTGNFSSAFVAAEFFTGVNKDSPIDIVVSSVGIAATSFNGLATTGRANEIVVDCINQAANPTLSAVAPSIRILNGSSSTAPVMGWGNSYQGPLSSVGNQTMGWTSTATGAWRQGSISIVPVSSGLKIKGGHLNVSGGHLGIK